MPRLLGAPDDAGLQHPLFDALPAGHLLNQGVDKSFKKFKLKPDPPSHATRRQARRGRACCGRFPPEIRRNARCQMLGARCQVLLTTHLLHRLEGNGCQPPHHVGVLLLVAPGQGDGAPGEILTTNYLAMSKWMYWILCSSGRNWLR